MKKYWLVPVVAITLFSFYDLYCVAVEFKELDWLSIVGKLVVDFYILGSATYILCKMYKKKNL
ncbi:hypothetical protein MK851_02395 [Tenacibaculum sp. 1B UA]|uniref:hypothetical protein n=1 Tax=Tenacibaculum sp. 1B UA TaxID=2922252 RepID=UPI002A243FF6|nr:hypothetical protein [Tenacibaculum sp. 1B UA]MDX8552473.1 hypothetical protein [Tenacibaculum sp. 1B UA]